MRHCAALHQVCARGLSKTDTIETFYFETDSEADAIVNPSEETETEALHYKTKAKTETSIGLDTEPKAL